MTNTHRRRNLTKTDIKCIQEKFDIKLSQGKFRDGSVWRGCDGSYCPVCSSNRQHKKNKEYIRGQEIIHEELIG